MGARKAAAAAKGFREDPFTAALAPNTEFMRNKCHRNGGMKFQYREERSAAQGQLMFAQ